MEMLILVKVCQIVVKPRVYPTAEELARFKSLKASLQSGNPAARTEKVTQKETLRWKKKTNDLVRFVV